MVQLVGARYRFQEWLAPKRVQVTARSRRDGRGPRSFLKEGDLAETRAGVQGIDRPSTARDLQRPLVDEVENLAELAFAHYYLAFIGMVRAKRAGEVLQDRWSERSKQWRAVQCRQLSGPHGDGLFCAFNRR